MLKTVVLGLALLPLSGPVPASAQSRTPAKNSTKLTQLKVTGSERFQPNVIAAATGLKLGDDGSDAPLKQGADRLAATGMFSDITFSYVSSPAGTKAEFHVNDTEKLFPIFFDNFVWLSAADLIKEIQKREPLFVGNIPNAGEMADRIANDIKNVLDDLHVSATVKMFPRMPQYGGDLLGFEYSVRGVNIPVVSVEFPGASPDMAALLQKTAATTTLLGSNYSETTVRSITRLDFAAQYHARGYLKAEFGDPVANLRDRTLGTVVITLPVQQGLQYKLNEVLWSGNKVYSQADLAKAIKDEPGKPLDQVKMEDELGGISKIYGTRGYMDARTNPKYDCDDASQTVVVAIEVTEGEQYHMGAVEFHGLSENATAHLRELWKLHPGEPYDSTYLSVFLGSMGQQFDMSRVKIQYKQQSHRESKTVDVSLTFAPKA